MWATTAIIAATQGQVSGICSGHRLAVATRCGEGDHGVERSTAPLLVAIELEQDLRGNL